MLPRQQTAAHQELVSLPRGFAALGDGGHDEVSAQPGVAGYEGAWLNGAEAVFGVDGAPVSVAKVHLPHETVAHGAREADGEQDEVGLYLEVRAFDRYSLSVGAFGLDCVHLFDVAFCAREACDGHGEAALAALLVGRVGVQDQGPVGPGEVVGALGRLRAVGEDLNGGATFAVGVTEAVRARVAAAEDHDVLAGGGDLDLRVRREARHPPVLLHQVVHGEVDATEFAARHIEVAALQGADGEDDGVELALEVFCGRVLTDVRVGTELHALLLHDGDAAVDDPLFDLVVGDTVPEETPDTIVLLEDDGRVPGPVELLRSREPRGPAPDDRDLPPRPLLRRCRPGDDPSLLEGPVDDGELYLFYGHGFVVDGEDAGGLAWSRAEHPRELGEVVGLVQAVYGLLPVLAVDEVVPVGDQISQRTASVAEGHTAVHAARGLPPELLVGHRPVDVAVVLDALLDGPLGGRLAPYFEESFGISH